MPDSRAFVEPVLLAGGGASSGIWPDVAVAAWKRGSWAFVLPKRGSG